MNRIRISKAPSLAELTSIGLGGKALAEVLVEDAPALERLPEIVRRLGGRPVMLGRGSNILARDGELPLLLVRLGRGFTAAEPRFLGSEEGGAAGVFAAPAAMPLPALVAKLCRGGWSGLQGLAGIPGSVGGAVAMNAGSFGMDMKGCLKAVSFFSARRGFFIRQAAELEIGYRHFAVPGLAEAADDFWLVTGALLHCRKSAPDTPAVRPGALAAELEEFRRRKARIQPVGERSAGCVFKNPALAPAGRLLEEAGFKGRALGGMAFSGRHANFLVNTGGGRSAEAFALIDAARAAVKTRSGVELELEVRVWE
jgi:UDP-N-acetylmuramate dehydrogenase